MLGNKNLYCALKKKQKEEISNLPLIFAFDQETLNSKLIELTGKNTDYGGLCKLGAVKGFYCLSKDLNLVKETFLRHKEQINDSMNDDKFVVDMFIYEMENCEYSWTLDDDDVLSSCGLSLERISKNKRLSKLFDYSKRKYLGDNYY